MVPLVLQNGQGLGQGQALAPQIGGPAGQKALAKAGAHGIQNGHHPAGELLHQGLRRQMGAVDGAADTGGQADVENVVPRLQYGPEGLLEGAGA